MKRTTGILEQYTKVFFIFLMLGVLCKVVETIYLIRWVESISFHSFIKSFLILWVAYSFYAVLLFPVYAILFFFNKTISNIFVSIILSLLVLFEAGLTVYFFHTGALLGAELFARPFSEVKSTIEATLNIWMLILAIMATIIFFYFILFLLNKKTLHRKIIITTTLVALIMASFFPLIPKSATGKESTTIKNYIQNKNLYCFTSTKEYFLSTQKNSDVEYDHERVLEFLKDNPERIITDLYYPLERAYEAINVLAPYFKPDTIKPNIVIFILESLGREWTYSDDKGVSFTPFLDSLANKGLYWKNCISTTRRSFGIVPSTTGSLPFGVKGFQFGNMPDHNSLIKILKKNYYKTHAFYAGAFYFDAVNDYLLAQDIDYMSEVYYKDYEKNKTENNGFPYWGYHDSIMYSKVLQDPHFLTATTPYFNLFITTSAHQLADKKNVHYKRAYQLLMEIIKSAPKDKQEYYLKRIDHAASIFYQDLCLKDFFESYNKREDFNHTIFIFTGDHASGMMQKNDLSPFHVPLLIWSPLLSTHKKFPALVSHNDLVPTLEALLREHYNLTSLPTTHWLGNSLDTSSVFASNLKTVMFDYSNGYKDIIYNNYYYNSQLFEIENGNLDLKEIQNDSVKEFMKNRLELYRYIHKYVYLNNKLTKESLYIKPAYKTIKDINIGTFSILFDSTPGWKSTTLYPETKIEGKWKKIKISITGDVMFLTIPENQQCTELMVVCDGQNMLNAHYYHDYINKLIMVEDIELEKWYPLHIERQFVVENVTDINIKIYFCIGGEKPRNYSKLKKTKILIQGEYEQ